MTVRFCEGREPPTYVERIRSEYREMPGLQLTRRQAARLFGLDEGTCDAALTSLVDARFLERTAHDCYVLANGLHYAPANQGGGGDRH